MTFERAQGIVAEFPLDCELHEEWSNCGKPNCGPCQGGKVKGHGPAYWTWIPGKGRRWVRKGDPTHEEILQAQAMCRAHFAKVEAEVTRARLQNEPIERQLAELRPQYFAAARPRVVKPRGRNGGRRAAVDVKVLDLAATPSGNENAAPKR